MPPDPKPRKRIRSKAGLDAMHAKVAAEGKCRICGKRNRPWLDAKGRSRNTLNADHIVERDQGGDDVAENAMPLCGSGTTGCHGEKHSGQPAVRKAMRLLMRAHMTAAELDYITERKGAWWLDDHFPTRRSVRPAD